MKALQRLLVLILLGFQMQGVKAEPQEIFKFQGFGLDHCLNHRAEVGSRWRMIQTCNSRQVEEKRSSQGRDQRTQKRNRKGEDPRTCEEKSQGRNPSTPERNSQGEDPSTFRGNRQERDPRTPNGRSH